MLMRPVHVREVYGFSCAFLPPTSPSSVAVGSFHSFESGMKSTCRYFGWAIETSNPSQLFLCRFSLLSKMHYQSVVLPLLEQSEWNAPHTLIQLGREYTSRRGRAARGDGLPIFEQV